MTELTAAYASAIVLGSGFGFQGSVSPGPLQTLMISETLSNGVRSSWRAAIVPLVTDPIALVVSLVIVSNISDAAIAIISFIGAFILCRIAWSELRTTADDFNFQRKPPRPWFEIWLVNFTNPNLWIFAFTVNGLQIHDYWTKWGGGVASAYILSFAAVLIFFNILTIVVVGRFKRALNANWLALINRALGIFLIVVTLRFVYICFVRMGILNDVASMTGAITGDNLFSLAREVKYICLCVFC